VNMDKITLFVERLKKIGIDVELVGNYPWIYLDKINEKKVTETYAANHGFTIAFMPIRKNQELKFTDIGEIFKLLRKYNDDKIVYKIDVGTMSPRKVRKKLKKLLKS